MAARLSAPILTLLSRVSTPTLDFPAMYEEMVGTIQYSETTVDGHVYPASPALVDGVEP